MHVRSDRHRSCTAHRAHCVAADERVLTHRRTVVRWALAHGHPIDRDALAVILGVRSGASPSTPPTLWTAAHVSSLLHSDARQWCLRHGVDEPRSLADTLSTYLRYLSSHREMAIGSDSINALRRSLASHPAPDGGSRSRHPAGGQRPNAPVVQLARSSAPT